MNYLDLATKIAKANSYASSQKHYSFGCVALRKDGAIVTSTNIRSRHRCASAHAEARVLKKAGHGAILWVVRIDRSGNWAMAKPCVHCESFIRNKMVKRVHYTISPNEYGTLNL